MVIAPSSLIWENLDTTTHNVTGSCYDMSTLSSSAYISNEAAVELYSDSHGYIGSYHYDDGHFNNYDSLKVKNHTPEHKKINYNPIRKDNNIFDSLNNWIKGII